MNSSTLKYFRAVAAASLLTLSALSAASVDAQSPQTPGKFDLTYANTGYKLDPWPNGAAIQGTDILVQPDGKVLAGVTSQFLVGAVGFQLWRYNPDGSPDETFGDAGRVATSFTTTGEVRALALQPDGKILAGGFSGNPEGFTIVRYNSNGTIDTSFGVNGTAFTRVGGRWQGNSLAIAPDGKIIMAGFQWMINTNGTNASMIARYNSNGTLDTSFDSDGYATTTLLDWSNAISALRVQPDGKVMIAGQTRTGDNFGVMRFNINGSVDTSFDTDGLVTTAMGTGASNIEAIELLPDGRIVAGGIANGSNRDFALARYNTDGSLDTSLDGDGKLLTPVGTGDDYLREIVAQPDGKIVAAGFSNNGTNFDFSFVRWNSDGSVDSAFGTNGKTIVNLGSTEMISGLALDPLGRATFAGRSNTVLITGRLRSENQPLVNVAGRLMSVSGNPIANVTVVMSDENQNTRFVLSNGFGYYNFTGVPEGATYTISLSSKRFTFSPESQTVGVTGEVLNIDFVGTPNDGRAAPSEISPGIKPMIKTTAEPLKKGGKQMLK